MSERLTINVKRIGSRYIAVLRLDGAIYDKAACELRVDIGCICRDMLRWYDKMGGTSAWAKSARRRHIWNPQGRVWNRLQLEAEKPRKKA